MLVADLAQKVNITEIKFKFKQTGTTGKKKIYIYIFIPLQIIFDH